MPDIPSPEMSAEAGSRTSQEVSDVSSLRAEVERPKELGHIHFNVKLKIASEKPTCTLQVSSSGKFC